MKFDKYNTIVTTNEIKKIIKDVLRDMRKHEPEFFDSKFDINERSLTHKMAEYLQKEFKNFSVDCEYNRMIDDNGNQVGKKITRCNKYKKGNPTSYEDKKGKTIYPDIVVHRRGLKGKGTNLVVIEVKKISNKTIENEKFDKCKLKALKDTSGKFGYENAYFVVVGNKEEEDIVSSV